MRTLLCLLLICQVVAGQTPAGMVLVPSGELSVNKSEKVKIKAFYMDTCEVTIAQFEQFINATVYKTDAEKKGFSICYGGDSIAGATWRCGPAGKLRSRQEYNLPVIHVSYNDATAYSKWIKKRLPTEDEWMYIASKKQNNSILKIAWGSENSNGDVHPVGMLLPNILGIYDLFGNVYEFVSPSFIRNNEEMVKVKGGCFVDAEKKNIERFLFYYKNMTTHMAGFRCVKDLQ